MYEKCKSIFVSNRVFNWSNLYGQENSMCPRKGSCKVKDGELAL